VSTRVEGATVLVMVKAHATLSAGPVHLVLFAGEGPAPGTWRYNLSDPDDRRIVYGRVAGKATHLEVLRYAAGRCVDAYPPGTVERGLLEEFAACGGDREGACAGDGEAQRGRAGGSPSGLCVASRRRPLCGAGGCGAVLGRGGLLSDLLSARCRPPDTAARALLILTLKLIFLGVRRRVQEGTRDRPCFSGGRGSRVPPRFCF
jgi:hypothetical protein